MKKAQEKQLELEIDHILDSGVNKVRLMEMLKPFIKGCEMVAFEEGKIQGAEELGNHILITIEP